MLNRFLVISKSINFAAYLSKWPSKNKGPTGVHAREVSIKLLKVTLTSYFFKMVTAT